jgi:hypothetical protein
VKRYSYGGTLSVMNRACESCKSRKKSVSAPAPVPKPAPTAQEVYDNCMSEVDALRVQREIAVAKAAKYPDDFLGSVWTRRIDAIDNAIFMQESVARKMVRKGARPRPSE